MGVFICLLRRGYSRRRFRGCYRWFSLDIDRYNLIIIEEDNLPARFEVSLSRTLNAWSIRKPFTNKIMVVGFLALLELLSQIDHYNLNLFCLTFSFFDSFKASPVKHLCTSETVAPDSLMIILCGN